MIITPRRPHVWFIAAVALLLISCRGSFDIEEAKTPFPTSTSTATPLPTPIPPTPLPFRMDCAAIESSQQFIHLTEQDWFINNCLTGPSVTISYDERLGIGARVMEIYTVDTAICPTGLVSFTALHQPDLEMFSYEFRNFCSYLDPITLAFPPPPFACPESDVIEAAEVTLAFLIDFVRQETEVFCSPAENPQEDDSGSFDEPYRPSGAMHRTYPASHASLSELLFSTVT